MKRARSCSRSAKTTANGDICYASCVVFLTKEFFGEIKNDPEEVLEHRFFDKDNVPEEINDFDRLFINIWREPEAGVAIYNGEKLYRQ